MKRPVVIISIILVAAGLGAGHIYWENLRGAGPVLPPPQDIAKLLETARSPAPAAACRPALALEVAAGLRHLHLRQEGAGRPGPGPGPRRHPPGEPHLPGPGGGLAGQEPDGVADAVVTVVDGLNGPTAWPSARETSPGSTWPRPRSGGCTIMTRKSHGHQQTENHRPAAGGPPFHPDPVFFRRPRDQRLLISVGSDCDVCEEKDSRYAKILVVDPDGSNLKTFASGLRNSVFMAAHPLTGHIWATEMGRDYLGDNLPPDEINIILEGRITAGLTVTANGSTTTSSTPRG